MRRADSVVAFDKQRAEVQDAAVAVFQQTRLTVSEAAREAHVSENTIRRAYGFKHLAIQRFGIGLRQIRIQRADLARWLEAGGQTGPQ